MMSEYYQQAYRESFEDREGFWLSAAKAVDWIDPPVRVWNGTDWFAGARLNSRCSHRGRPWAVKAAAPKPLPPGSR
jgi:hypothetical protein